MRWLFAFVMVFAGCVLTVPQDHSISADLAAETARCVVEMRAAVRPDPPKPSDSKCTNCDGRGYVGDGVVRVKCQPCDGTGKEPKSVLVNE